MAKSDQGCGSGTNRANLLSPYLVLCHALIWLGSGNSESWTGGVVPSIEVNPVDII